jgi:hypothetical protein
MSDQQSSVDYHTNQWLMLQHRLNNRLYDNEREKFRLENLQRYHEDEFLLLQGQEFLSELPISTTHHIPPS